jgi:hypothetical protein
MINVDTIDGKIAVKCGEATGADLICEASAAVVSVIVAAIKRCKSKKRKEALAKEVFVNITGMAATIVEKEHGISVWPDDDDEDDNEEETIIAKAIPKDSETGRKLMELLGIDPDEAKSGDDETEDDIPKFLF